MQKFLFVTLFFILCGCASSQNQVTPTTTPTVVKEKEVITVKPNNIIGAIEPIYILPMKTPFEARIDTGATTSSIDASDIKYFERDGEKWVKFTVTNRVNGEQYTFEKPTTKRRKIKRIEESEHRMTVEMDVKFGGKKFKAEFTLAERTAFDYQALVGRNILNGRAIVDVSISNTLH